MIPTNESKPLPGAFVANGQLITGPAPNFFLTAEKGGIWIDRSKLGVATIRVSFLREGVIDPAGFASCQRPLETFFLN